MIAESDGGLAYAVLGCGRQGTASALDLARLGHADRILLADADGERAEALGERLRGWMPTATSGS